MKSLTIKEQTDYKKMMEYINKMVNKKESPAGSVILGKKYANFYLNEINEMLSLEDIDKNIFTKLSEKVSPDLIFIREDCQRRMYWSEDVQDNDNMMSMITDFILSL